MSNTLAVKLAGTPAGRCWLHLVCVNLDWKIRWHLAGVWREIKKGLA